jgi:hypothetical protein
LESEVIIPSAGSKFDKQGSFRDEKGKKLIRLLLISLVVWARELLSI